MKNIKIQYTVFGAVHEVICLRREYAFQVLRNIRTLPNATAIKVIGLDAEIVKTRQDSKDSAVQSGTILKF